VLGLTVPTDPQWVRAALRELSPTLIDHAHCELKAASNALSLVTRYPDDTPLVTALTALAREELEHFDQAMRLLSARGLTLGIPAVNQYAQRLRSIAATLPQRHIERLVLVDRLLVGAVIEARSCERFKLLADALSGTSATSAQPDVELGQFYQELFICEARHYRTYVDLAKLAARAGVNGGSNADTDAMVEARLRELAMREGEIIRELSNNMHRAMIHG
jgi:tRNA 2-(methylsulfanyl)-N6-isopentenyladenosine37 hydroxylase